MRVLSEAASKERVSGLFTKTPLRPRTARNTPRGGSLAEAEEERGACVGQADDGHAHTVCLTTREGLFHCRRASKFFSDGSERVTQNHNPYEPVGLAADVLHQTFESMPE